MNHPIRNQQFHYIYCITNVIDGMRYIGKRSSFKQPEFDTYWGSGTRLKRAQKHHGLQNFTKEIWLMLPSSEEALIAESFFVCQSIVDSPDYYNLRLGGTGGSSIMNKTKEFREKIGLTKIGNKNCVGRKYSEETLTKMRESARKRWEKPEEHEKCSILTKLAMEKLKYVTITSQ